MDQPDIELAEKSSSSLTPTETQPEPKTRSSSHQEDEAFEAVAPGEATEETSSSKKSWAFHLAFIGLSFAMFVFQLDGTALGVVIPTIAADLQGTSLESFWANLAYTLCVVVTQPNWATFSDAFGRKPALCTSMALFTFGSLTFALAQNMETIIAGRVLQGLGGGGIDVLCEIILADMTTLEERSFWLGMLALPISLGNILGPTIAAIFSTYASWRWLGWVNLPFLGVAFPLVIFFLRLRSVRLDSSFTSSFRSMDWIGIVLYLIGITIFVLPLSWAGSLYPWNSWRTLLPMLLGVLVLLIFAFYERQPAAPLVPHRLFRSRTANVTLVGGFMHGVILFTIIQYLPLLYQAVQLETVIGSAVDLLPTSVLSVVVAVGSSVLVGVVGGGYRWIIWSSWIILTVGTGLLALLDQTSSSSMRLGLPIIWGVGIAPRRLLHLPMQASVKNVDDTSLAIGQLLTFRLFGGVVGLAVASTIFSSIFSTSASSNNQRFTGPLVPLQQSGEAVEFIPQLRQLNSVSIDLDPALSVYLQSFRTIFYTMAGCAGVGFIASLFMEELDLHRTERTRQQFED